MSQIIQIPDIGDSKAVDVIEILVKVGQQVDKDAPLITLESEKATMEIPSPYKGEVKKILVSVGSKVKQGDNIIEIEVSEGAKQEAPKTEPKKEEVKKPEPQKEAPPVSPPVSPAPTPAPAQMSENLSEVYAGPAVRRFARELGVSLQQVKGTGRKGRILTKDVQQYVKQALQKGASGGGFGLSMAVAEMADIDFSKWGPVRQEPLSRIKKFSGANLHRNWLVIPHVTQFDEADITEMEKFRKEQQPLAEKEGIRLTPLVFLMKAAVYALRNFPDFNASLDKTGENLIYKQYYHIGVAVDTPNGLVVPVVRDVDQKGLFQLSKELGEVSEKARKGQLTAQDMQGSTFTISSLGGIGGTQFTPIVNHPDVAILGVSKASQKPIYQDGQFVPRLMLPLALSYNHRVIDGASAVRFTTFLVQQLSDIRRLLL